MDLATPEAFRRDPGLVWRWYQWRRQFIADAVPNPGHRALALMERELDDFTLITQNVDGFHHAAGSRHVLELHGNISRTVCSGDGSVIENGNGGETPPPCPRCGAPGRPDVVWFGEALPARVLEQAFEAARQCEVFFSVGTSSVVQPAASMPWIALESGAMVVEINPEPTALSEHAHHTLPGASGEVLPAIVRGAFDARV